MVVGVRYVIPVVEPRNNPGTGGVFLGYLYNKTVITGIEVVAI